MRGESDSVGKDKYNEKGVPLVLLHGFPFDHALWRAQMGEAIHGVVIMTPDLAGFGSAPPLTGEPTMDAYADAIADWAEAQGLRRFALGGHSMGGYVAFAFARRHAEMLSGLALICTRPGPDSDAGREGRYKQIEEVRKRGPQAVVDAMLPKLLAPGSVEEHPDLVDEVRRMMLRQTPEAIIAALTAMAERPDSTPGLADITVPTIIITGAEDAIIPAPEADGMKSRISGSRHIPIEGAAHLPMLEKPDAFNEALKAFADRRLTTDD